MKQPIIVQESRIGAREKNEDRVAHWSSSASVAMAVADGLGGHAHGELAAQVVVDVVGASYEAEARPLVADPAGFLVRSLAAGHAAIVREAEKRDLIDHPRTVIAACVVQEGRVHWTHVGDCRFYLLRGGEVIARSRDHTVVQQLVDEGRIPQELAGMHPLRNRLLQCLGGYETPRIGPVESASLASRDVVLLCSDGFWGPLPEREVVKALLSRPLDQAIGELVAAAESGAGFDCDNISVVALRWE
ncbi:MAG TPA: PP2C family serine/threonine-protein phosphatase [Burkholderiales bacterium]|jgi:serine/threonine protein phosphatase PrpC|nr:PP2C family serine/threonine-protein phosphatase [Burkholderiales bacterium]